MSSSWSSWPVWVCNHRSRPGASFITVICMRFFIFVAVRHRFQCFVALVFLCDSTHCWPVLSLHQPMGLNFFTTVSLLFSVPLPPHLWQALVRKRSCAPMMLTKMWGLCRAGQPHCDSTMTSVILPLISSPEPPKPHVSVVIDARRKFPKFQMFESRWPPALRLPRGGEASHWKRFFFLI